MFIAIIPLGGGNLSETNYHHQSTRGSNKIPDYSTQYGSTRPKGPCCQILVIFLKTRWPLANNFTAKTEKYLEWFVRCLNYDSLFFLLFFFLVLIFVGWLYCFCPYVFCLNYFFSIACFSVLCHCYRRRFVL